MKNFCKCLSCEKCKQSSEVSRHYSCKEGEFTNLGLIDIIDNIGFHTGCEKFEEAI